MTRLSARAGAGLAAFFAVMTALLPLTTLLLPSWLLPAGAAVLAMGVLGAIGRRFHPALALAAQLVALAVVTWWAFFPQVLIGGLVPSAEGWLLPDVIWAAGDELMTGIAPMGVGQSLAFVLIVASALIAMFVDQVAVALRMPIVAALPLVCVFIAPQLAVPRGDHLVFAIPFVLALLALIALGGSSKRQSERDRTGAGAMTLVTAVIVAVVAVAVAPLVPVMPSADSGILARGSSVDVSIDLGNDLRSASTDEVLRVRTEQNRAPYLRLATNTLFDEDGWHIDGGPSAPLEDGFGEVTPSGLVGEIESERALTWVSDVTLDAQYLPIPANAIEVRGSGGGWLAMLDNRTVRSTSESSEDTRYVTMAEILSPSREQLDASPWVSSSQQATAELPGASLRVEGSVINGAIGDAAREVTVDDRTPYEAALSLQSWLRGPDFEYSLETPVEEGFDGSDAEATEQFLITREGYCVHFASTFALMARSVGIPTRVAIGYLPGTTTSERIGDLPVYSVTADRLHAWPEVYLVGVGWTPFEPTPSIAQAQSVVASEGASATGGDEPEVERSQAPLAEETPTPTPTASADAENGGGADDAGSSSVALWILIAVGVVVAAALIVSVPALVRFALRSARMRAAARGDVASAWRELRALASDAGISFEPSDSPRAIGAVLIGSGADPTAVGTLTSAVEQASFAASPAAAGDLAGPLRTVSAGIRSDRTATRILRAMLPRSLWTRK
ncbi:transglutaminase family protein [Microbacterium gubbeenense]|uniref:transglutaminase family protein n=1 Tax=Microbacterium gubbeenense TaxID=159896 RepID=UPI003F9C9131